ncbi:hypothetical protein [Sphaerisporangium aureirubrum]|uniref:Uncharacterized protein n=1 Tax=Sphaerisporangium aureirubrum TaxID=1544736 RepID=A0ABW1NDL2_9ACTN
MDEATHKCARRRCATQIRMGLLMCPPDWALVPQHIQRAVYRAYRARPRDWAAYAAAVRDAQNAVDATEYPATLQHAATILRARAQAAGGEQWEAHDFTEGTIVRPRSIFRLPPSISSQLHGPDPWRCGPPCVTPEDGVFIATMNPQLAALFADLLEEASAIATANLKNPRQAPRDITKALAVAHEILGSDRA